METIENLIEEAYANGKILDIESLKKLNLSLEEFEKVASILEKNGIEIKTNASIDCDKLKNVTDSLQMYISEIKKYPLLTEEQEKELIKQYKSGSEEAKQKLICSNLRFVVKVASRYASMIKASTNDVLDMIQYGNIGLIKGIERFDLNKNFRLTTYAYWYIDNEISRENYYTGSTIRLPIDVSVNLTKIYKFKRQFELDNGREPNEYECAEGLNCSAKKVIDLLRVSRNIRNIKSLGEEIIKDENSGESLVDFIVSEDTFDDYEKVLSDITASDILKKAKRVLTSREFKILLERTGLNEKGEIIGDGKKLEDLGQELNLTRERVRQILKSTSLKIKKIK